MLAPENIAANNSNGNSSRNTISNATRDVATEDGMLEAREMMNLTLRARLVVLSACETGRGRVRAGEGVIGMSWALLVAGAPTVVVSQWQVESVSTTSLMREFHGRLQASAPSAAKNLSSSEALRQASLQLLSREQYAHPFYWACFVLIGDGD